MEIRGRSGGGQTEHVAPALFDARQRRRRVAAWAANSWRSAPRVRLARHLAPRGRSRASKPDSHRPCCAPRHRPQEAPVPHAGGDRGRRPRRARPWSRRWRSRRAATPQMWSALRPPPSSPRRDSPSARTRRPCRGGATRAPTRVGRPRPAPARRRRGGDRARHAGDRRRSHGRAWSTKRSAKRPEKTIAAAQVRVSVREESARPASPEFEPQDGRPAWRTQQPLRELKARRAPVVRAVDVRGDRLARQLDDEV